jgi:CheY-like chemotaxis protein
VDDDREILTIAQGMLERLGYQVTRAADGLEATQLFCREPEAFDLVLLDMTMPRMDGPEALDLMRRARPEVRVILSSGYPEESILTEDLRRRAAGFIQKPYKLRELKEVLGES